MFTRLITSIAVFLLVGVATARGDDAWATFAGSAGKAASGKKVVLVAADNEYRAEEGLTQLAQILATRHGFDCTVLYAVNPQTGEVDPMYNENIPGLEKLAAADALVIWTRFRNLPDEQMRFIDDYLLAGRPVMGLRTSTHAFNIPADRAYARYSWDAAAATGWEQGFGRLVLGETWINHHGHHGFEATRGVIAADKKLSPLVRGCTDIFGPTDVYTVRLPLPAGCDVLVYGEVLSGMNRTDSPVAAKNDPMMPIAWTRQYQLPSGKAGRAYTTTLGSAVDFSSEGVRRLAVAGVYWLVGLEDKIADLLDVSIVGTYEPSPMGNDRHRHGIKPNQMR